MAHLESLLRHLLVLGLIGCGADKGADPTSPARSASGSATPLANTAPPPAPSPPDASAGIPTQAQVAALDETPYPDVEARCKANDSAACTQLGTRLRIGSRDAPHDMPRAFTVLDAACTAQQSRGPACSHLAEMHLGGHGTKRDNRRALEILERACDGGELEACRFFGVILYEGLAMPELRYSADNQRRGLDVLQKACEGGYQRACESVDARRGPPSAPP